MRTEYENTNNKMNKRWSLLYQDIENKEAIMGRIACLQYDFWGYAMDLASIYVWLEDNSFQKLCPVKF